MKEYSVIGKPWPRVDSTPKVTGTMKYINDIMLPGMLYGKILRSRYAHAKIINIDTSKAEKLSGVKAVITSKDIPEVHFGSYKGGDEYVLARDKVRYIGDQVAVVVADDEDTAEEALDLIEVTYEELPAVFSAEEAMKPGAPILYDEVKDNLGYKVEGNVGFKVTHVVGDVEKGFAEADFVREDRFEVPMISPAWLGPRGAVADYNKATGEITIYGEIQIPFMYIPQFARVVGIPEGKVRVFRPHIGGGFGPKSPLLAGMFPCAAFGSMRTGRPVKIMHTRAEEFMTSRGREPLVTYFKTGVKKDGTLTAVQCKQIGSMGANLAQSAYYALQNVGVFDLQLRCPNVRFEALCVYTNTVPSRTVRGLNNQALNLGQQCHWNMLAKDIGIDVIDFYLKNAHRAGDATTSRYKLDSCGLAECIQAVAEASKWKERQGKLGPNRGLGFACAAHTAGFKWSQAQPDRSTVVVTVDNWGNVRVESARAAMGQGSSTMIVMIVAEELGLSPNDITINDYVDTKETPFDMGSYASRGTIQQGNATIAAARNLRQQLFEVVASKLGVSVDNLEARDGRIFVKGAPDKGMPFKEAIRTYDAAGKPMPLIGRGHYDPPTEPFDLETGEGNVSIGYGFGAQVAEVEVDRETGQVNVLKVWAANDCGKILNPLILDGESQGGVSMGLGMGLFEEISYDEKGRVRELSFKDYRLPTVIQQPDVESFWIETIDPHGPYGAKGITEVVSMPPAPAIANAVYDAIGVRIRQLPLHPWRILDALKKKETSGK